MVKDKDMKILIKIYEILQQLIILHAPTARYAQRLMTQLEELKALIGGKKGK